MISKKIFHQYITFYYDEKFITDESLNKIRSLGFDVKIYDDSNEFSEIFHDKVRISWNYIGKNYPDIEDE